jgi:hypothetical protein
MEMVEAEVRVVAEVAIKGALSDRVDSVSVQNVARKFHTSGAPSARR